MWKLTWHCCVCWNPVKGRVDFEDGWLSSFIKMEWNLVRWPGPNFHKKISRKINFLYELRFHGLFLFYSDYPLFGTQKSGRIVELTKTNILEEMLLKEQIRAIFVFLNLALVILFTDSSNSDNWVKLYPQKYGRSNKPGTDWQATHYRGEKHQCCILWTLYLYRFYIWNLQLLII